MWRAHRGQVNGKGIDGWWSPLHRDSPDRWTVELSCETAGFGAGVQRH